MPERSVVAAQLFQSKWSAVGILKAEREGPMEAGVTLQSQSFRLRERMEEANISHGQEIRADLPNIRVVALAGGGAGQALFCTMGSIRVREILNRGDERPLPTDVMLEGLRVSGSGSYDILNALVSSNGNLRVVVDDQTSVVPAAKGIGAAAASTAEV
jgi:hypothetical protein